MNSFFSIFGQYPFILPVLFLVGIFIVGSIVHKKRIEALRGAASELGLQFIEKDAIVQQTTVDRWQQALDVWELSGTYHGVSVRLFARVSSHGRNKTTSTYIVAFFKEKIPGNINIAPDNAFYKFVSFVLPKEVKVGDEALDNKYYLLGDSAETMRSFLKRRGVENALDELFAFSKLISVRSDGIWSQTPGHVTDVNKLREILDMLTNKVKIFDESQGEKSSF